MKKVLLSIAAAATLAAAVPAMAAPYGPGPGYPPVFAPVYGGAEINQRERDIDFRIDRGVRDGSLNWYEARGLRSQLSGIQRLQYRYMRDGLNGWERADLNARLDRLSYAVRGERHDGDRFGGARFGGERSDGPRRF